MGHRSAVVDLGGTQVRTGIWDKERGLLGKQVERTDHSAGPRSATAQIARMLRASQQSAGAGDTARDRLVIASPGPLDPRAGMVFRPPNMPGWGEVPLQAMLEAATGLPTTLVNDATAAGFGEFRFGAGRGCRNLVYFTISTGIGGGVVVDGKMLEGSTGSGAELGHMMIDRNGPPCPCGSVGCLEVLASGTSIARRFTEALAAGLQSTVESWTSVNGPTAADVARGAAAGDPLAREIFGDAAEAIGCAVVNVLHIFNPEVVVLGGGVTKAGELLFGPIRTRVASHAIPQAREAARILMAELGDDVGILGAAAVTEEIFRAEGRE